MKYAFTADWHVSRYADDKLNSIEKSIHSIARYCEKHKISHIIVGGDLFHGKSVIYAPGQNMLLQYFNDFPEIKFTIIDGNHDLTSRAEGGDSALKCFDSLPNVTRITKSFHDESNDILYVPYSKDMIEIIKSGKAKTLISHFGLDEGVLNSGISIVSDLKMKDLRGRYKLVLLGHYHAPQMITDENDLIIVYAGSPIQLDWGEKHEQKRFLIVNSDTNKVDTVPTFGYKKHFELEMTNDTKEEVILSARQLLNEGHQVRVVKLEDIDTKDITDIRMIDKTDKDITNRGITTSMSEFDKLEKYVEIKGITEEKEKEFLINTAITIIDRAKENQAEIT